MRLFKRVSAIAASALMLGMTAGIAAAANYPNPFVVGGSANVAIVYGTGSGVSSLDLVQAGNIQTNLQSFLGGGTSSTTGSVSGEAAELFTGGSKIYINDTLNSVKTVLTDTNLPTVLADKIFSGNVEATITQTITLGSDPVVEYAKMPSSSDDPALGLGFSTTSGLYLYNASASFNKAINFTHSDSEGEDIDLFGTTWTISAATDTSDLVLLKSAEKVSLSSDSPSADITVAGETYTVELVSASDTGATIKVIDSAGTSETKEINEAASKTVNGITVAVTAADENNLKLTATIVAGSDKITLTDGSSITHGEDASVIDGTIADIVGGTGACTKITVSIYAPESDEDAILAGESFVDPVFGTFKLDFPGFSIAEESASRETMTFTNAGDDRMQVKVTDARGYEKEIQYAYNNSAMALQWDTNGHNIIVKERTPVNYSDYVILGNEDEGRLVKLSTINNQTTGYSQDRIVFTDVFSGDTYDASISSEGGGTVVIGGKEYTLEFNFANSIASEARTVMIQYPDSSGTGDVIIYPTIETSKGAKIMFYKPLVLNVTTWDTVLDDGGTLATGTYTGHPLSNIKIPNGADSYETLAVDTSDTVNVSVGGHILGDGGVSNFTVINITNTGLSFNFSKGRNTSSGTYMSNSTIAIWLTEPDGNGNIVDPAIVILEEKDDNNNYEAYIVVTEPGQDSDDGIGVSDLLRTWSDDATWDDISLYSDSQKTKESDLWGTIGLIDSGVSDQKTATISYPDEQVYALLYMAEESASITTGGSSSTAGAQLGNVLVKDSEVSSVKSKNLIVVGGSCINSVAADLVGGAYCTSSWTSSTGIGSGQFLIQSFGDKYTTGKIALLVAGYEASDTVNAATYLTTKTVDTSAGKKYKGTSATQATLVTETA